MEKGKVSIVVPIYKVELYINECIDSILNQTYNNLQIILVDDGSPDRCGEIIEGYKKTDNRVITVHKPNGGLSSARNEGMKYADGEYIAFIDSDDVINSNYVERLVDIIRKDNSDIAVCAFSSFMDKIENVSKSSSASIAKMDSKKAIFEMYKNNSIGWSAWNKLYKYDLFDDIEYPVGVLCEDKATTYKLYLKAKSISYTTEVLYYYRLRGNSITGELSINYCLDVIKINNSMENDYESRGLSDEVLLAKSYSAKCALLLYAKVRNKMGYEQIKEMSIAELSAKYKYAKYAKYLRRSERIMLLLSGVSSTTKSRILLEFSSKIIEYLKKQK